MDEQIEVQKDQVTCATSFEAMTHNPESPINFAASRKRGTGPLLFLLGKLPVRRDDVICKPLQL